MAPRSNNGIRNYYDDPLVIAEDFIVFKVSEDKITPRIGIGSGNPWVPAESKREGKPRHRDHDNPDCQNTLISFR